ncbi:sperm equatorial segment protein 1 isoform X3 [Carettochelys insculpta]|uniref:sperm equatorial segment protein 1 isoform X3 n=1 Tax=Carettochelys insculpta TaxID=44489 RepID=UPI003EBB04D4
MAGERLLLLAAALALLSAAPPQSASAREPGPATQAFQHTFETLEHIKISVTPTSSIQVTTLGTDNLTIYESYTTPFGSEEKKEEKTLRSLVAILQDMIQNVPTQRTPTEQAIHTPKRVKSYINESVHSFWLNIGQKHHTKQKKSKQKSAVTRKFTPSTTPPFWRLRTDTEVSIVLHTNESSSSTTPLKEVFVTFENNVLRKKSKTFDQLTNGSLQNLVQSLKNVKKLQETGNITKKVEKQKHVAKVKKLHLFRKVKHRPVGEAILEKIEKLKKLLQRPPDYVKQNSHLKEYVESSESYITKALMAEKEAETSLGQLYHQPKTSPPKENLEHNTVIVEHDTAEIRKLRAFINLLYDFSPELTTYIESSDKKYVPENISEKAIAILNAMKHVFCGNQGEQNKKMLKKLLEDDINLLNIVLKKQTLSSLK